jgi:hypothetical protein
VPMASKEDRRCKRGFNILYDRFSSYVSIPPKSGGTYAR